MSLTEAIIFSFSRLCRWQKRLFSLFHAYVVDRSDYFSPFALSEMFRSTKNLHLLFLKRSAARKTSICAFWNVQKHENSPFGLSETFRSTKNLYMAFLKRSEAWKSSICSFWNVQKHENKKIICKITIQSLFLYANEDLLNLEIPHGTQEWYEMSHKLTHASSTHYAYEQLYKGAWEI